MARVVDPAEEAETQSAAALATGGKAAPTIGRIVHVTTRTGRRMPAIVTATIDTIDAGEEELPPLSSPMHTHLTVFEPDSETGSHAEWDVPFGDDGDLGSWMWPPRYA